MSPILLIILNVFAQQSPEMVFVDGDDVIQYLASATLHPTFGNAILPRTPERCP